MPESKASSTLTMNNTADASLPTPTKEDVSAASSTHEAPPKFETNARFWLIFLALCVSTFLSALDLTAVSTALPAIAEHYKSSEYSWVGSAYALTSTALVPWTGGIASIFGRRATMLGSLVFFAIGSAVSGAAPTMGTLIAGRAIQGVGGGGILVMTEIVIVDIVPLAQRGAYFGIIGGIWALASAIGPPLGGAFATAGQWRWLFYMNLPIVAIAMVLVLLFLNLKSPGGTLKEKMAKMDYYNFLFVLSSTLAILGLTWGGITAPWASAQVLVPLIFGILGMGLFLYVERFAKHPTVPFDVLTHPTAILGHFSNLLHGIIVTSVVYYLPVYFQAAKTSSAVRSGVQLFGVAFTVAPFAIFTGAFVTITGHWKGPNIVGYALAILGIGLFSLLSPESNTATWVGVQIPVGVGTGILYAAVQFAVLAPIRPNQQTQAVAFFTFVRSFAQTIAIAMGATAMQNRLNSELPQEFLDLFGEHAKEIAYASIPVIPTLEPVLKKQVQDAFVSALGLIWYILIGVAGLGLVVSIFLKQMPLATITDDEWGMKEKKVKDPEKSGAATPTA